MQLFLFNPQIGSYQVLPIRARVDLGAMAMKGYSAFTKAPALLEPHHQIVQCHLQDIRWGGCLTPLQRRSRSIQRLHIIIFKRLYGSDFRLSSSSSLGGACGVIVIVIGNEHGDTSSNPGRNSLHFT